MRGQSDSDKETTKMGKLTTMRGWSGEGWMMRGRGEGKEARRRERVTTIDRDGDKEVGGVGKMGVPGKGHQFYQSILLVKPVYNCINREANS